MLNSRIYLDYAAATPLDRRVAKVMAPFLAAKFGNPSSVHAEGRAAKLAIDQARQTVAGVLNARLAEIIFTSGATESINLAYRGIIKAAPAEQRHVVTLQTEHMATLRALSDAGCSLTFIPVAADGLVKVDDVMAAIKPDTVLVTIMTANNEIGTILPIAEIARAITKLRRATKSAYPLFHTDAVQSANSLSLDVSKLQVDALSLSGSKIYGPKGSGLLYVKQGTPITPQIVGGTQEHGLRAGTENVPAIIGFAAALQFAQEHIDEYNKHLLPLQKMLLDGILQAIPGSFVNGALKARLCSNVSVTLPNVDGEAVVMYLNEAGIAASTASSCTSSAGASHVLLALGLTAEQAAGSVRFTLGRGTTARQIKKVLQELPRITRLLSLN